MSRDSYTLCAPSYVYLALYPTPLITIPSRGACYPSLSPKLPARQLAALGGLPPLDVGFGVDGDEDEDEPPGECVSDSKPGPEVSLIV